MAKIEKDLPLSSHTKLNYYECYAKIVLEDVFSEQFCDLIIADKPDLQSSGKGIGIEVTIADNQKTLETERLYSQLPYTSSSEIQRRIERIEQCGAKYEHGILLTFGNDNFNLVNEAVNRKTNKLQNTGYAPFQEYHLFVFSNICANDIMLQEELAFLQSIHADNVWGKIYILVPGDLYCFSLGEATYKRIGIDFDTQLQHALKARQMVEEGEEDDQT